jgi:hypothetical protein
MMKTRYKSEEVEDWKWMAIDDVKDGIRKSTPYGLK